MRFWRTGPSPFRVVGDPRDRGGKGKRRPNRTNADQYTFAYPECSAYPEYSKINFWTTIFPHVDQNLSINLNRIQFFLYLWPRLL